MKITRGLLLASGLASVALAATPASAVTFNLINTGGAGAGTQARAGFEAAASYWSSVLTDNMTVNLQIGFQSLGAGILGSTGSARSLVATEDMYLALAGDITSALDTSAVATLRPLTPSTDPNVLGLGALTFVANDLNAARTRYVDETTRIDNDGSVNNATLAINKSVAKALGFTTDVNGATINYNSADAGVTFSSNFAFDFNPADGITAGQFDFIGVAIHEIGHALGFVSGVDSYDAWTSPGGAAANTGPNALEDFVVNSGLDLFRYSAPGVLDWSTSSSDKYFSIDGGATQLFGDSRFSTGRFNGDGQQASHWKDKGGCTDQIGIMDPNFCNQQTGEITASDLAAFDATGYNISFDVLGNPTYKRTTAQVYAAFAGVPEPSTWAMMIAGFGFVGASMRRAQTRKVSLAA